MAIDYADKVLRELIQGGSVWRAMTLEERRDVLQDVVAATVAVADEWVQIAAEMKGLSLSSPLVGEEWISGPYPLITGAGALAATLDSLHRGESPVEGFQITSAPGDRRAVRVLPHSIFDRLLLSGFRAEVWTVPGTTDEQVRVDAGLGQLKSSDWAGVGLVLGAGNIMSIPALDTLYEIFAHNRVVVLKLNPLTDSMKPVLEAALAPLVDRKLVRIVCGGAELGSYLAHHPDVDHVHMTGSARTHDSIVFGDVDESSTFNPSREPLLQKEISSELGGVSPTIVVPGDWSHSDVRFQAEHIVTQKLHNNGYNCVASQVLVLHSGWGHKDALLREIRSLMDRLPGREAYYPGGEDRLNDFEARHTGSTSLGEGGSRVIATASPDDPYFEDEVFGPGLLVVEIEGAEDDFLGNAVTFANARLMGTLGANIIAHPRTIRKLGSSFDEAVASLKYGTIAVNAWTGLAFLTARAAWGAYPGHTLNDIQSGTGVVHNALLLPHTERTVVRGPFKPFPRAIFSSEPNLSPRPPWFVTNKTAHETGRKLTLFSAAPSWMKLPSIFWSALRG